MFEFGRNLVLPWKLVNIYLSNIERNYASRSQHCLTVTIAGWLNGESQPSTWREAVKAATHCLSYNTPKTAIFEKGVLFILII